jgi:hypothetical protein
MVNSLEALNLIIRYSRLQFNVTLVLLGIRRDEY